MRVFQSMIYTSLVERSCSNRFKTALKGNVLNSSTFTHHINYQMKGRDVCYGNEK